MKRRASWSRARSPAWRSPVESVAEALVSDAQRKPQIVPPEGSSLPEGVEDEVVEVIAVDRSIAATVCGS